ncbi:MAG: zinc-ribbon domain-containing protein, partial [Anaerolineae bacterium]
MVRCSRCGYENRDGAKFCAHCQASLGQESPISEVVGQSPRLRMAVSIIVGIICLIYLINPTAGLLELIPDN